MKPLNSDYETRHNMFNKFDVYANFKWSNEINYNRKSIL